jgi:hypothetical protein
VLVYEQTHDLSGPIAASIVYDQDRGRVLLLAQVRDDRLTGGEDLFFLIVRRDDDGQKGLAHGDPFFCALP